MSKYQMHTTMNVSESTRLDPNALQAKSLTFGTSVEALVDVNLARLSKLCITFEDKTQIDCVTALQQTPRAGKAVRLKRSKLDLPVRSVYDHVQSLGHNADLFLSLTSQKLSKKDLAGCIAFHDLHEILLGDIPRFTDYSLSGMVSLSAEEKHNLELAADTELSNNLPAEFKHTFDDTAYTLYGGNSPVSRFFQMLDKSDPIIAIWRYLPTLRGTTEARSFIIAMDDFFINPKVRTFCVDPKINKLVKQLQNPRNAEIYSQDKSFLKVIAQHTEIDLAVLVSLIEERDMNYAIHTRKIKKVQSFQVTD